MELLPSKDGADVYIIKPYESSYDVVRENLEAIKLDRVRKSESYDMTLPHPRALERAFVLAPLLDLYPTGRAPGMLFGPHLRDMGFDGVDKTEKEIIIPIY